MILGNLTTSTLNYLLTMLQKFKGMLRGPLVIQMLVPTGQLLSVQQIQVFQPKNLLGDSVELPQL